MAEGDTTGEKDWAVEEPVPMLALSVWEASAQEHACNPSAGLWAASQKEASAPGERRNVGLLTVVWAWENLHALSMRQCHCLVQH